MTLEQLLKLGIEIVQDEREVIVYSFNERLDKDPRGPKVTDRDARRYLRQYDRFLEHARLQLVALIRARIARERAAKPRRSRR